MWLLFLFRLLFFFVRHRQSQLICPQCNKCEDRLNRFPLEVRLIYAYTVLHSQRAGISLSFSSLFFFFFYLFLLFYCYFIFVSISFSPAVMYCSFNFHFRFFLLFSTCFFLAAIGMGFVAGFTERHRSAEKKKTEYDFEGMAWTPLDLIVCQSVSCKIDYEKITSLMTFTTIYIVKKQIWSILFAVCFLWYTFF